MGTLGCINDMLQRDKENRELRKRNRERLTDTYHRLLDTGKETDLSQMTVEKMERHPPENVGKKKNWIRLPILDDALFSFGDGIDSSLGMVTYGM